MTAHCSMGGLARRLGRMAATTATRAFALFNEHQKIDPTAGPDKTGDDHIDWNMWLGHEWGLRRKIPWTPEHFFRFRKYWPYNGGVATDLLYHKLAPLADRDFRGRMANIRRG